MKQLFNFRLCQNYVPVMHNLQYNFAYDNYIGIADLFILRSKTDTDRSVPIDVMQFVVLCPMVPIKGNMLVICPPLQNPVESPWYTG